MAREEKLLSLIKEIAKEQNYDDSSIALEPVSSGGANYSSHLYLATLKAPGKNDLQLFAKSAAIGEKMREIMPSSAFLTEHNFYRDLMKTYREIEDKYNIKAEDRLITAKYYGASGEYLHEILVLENLSKRGFQSFDRFQSIDWPYAHFCIKQLAIFHALSLAFKKEDPVGYENFVTTKLISGIGEAITEFLQIDVDKTIRAVKEENKARVAKFLEKPDIRKPMAQLYSAQGPMIIHGDYRPSNMMYRKLSDGNTEVMVLDYQTLFMGNPVTDLLYFLFLSTDKKFRDQYLTKSFEYYHQELSSALRRFNLDPEELYNKNTYEKDLEKNIPYMLSSSFYMLLIITIDPAVGQITEDMDLLKMDLDTNKTYLERLNDWIDDCIDMDVL